MCVRACVMLCMCGSMICLARKEEGGEYMGNGFVLLSMNKKEMQHLTLQNV